MKNAVKLCKNSKKMLYFYGMKNKSLFVKAIIPGLIVLTILIGTMIYLFVPKKENVALAILSNDISIKVGEEKRISYTTSNPYAFVSFEIEDTNVAKLDGLNVIGVNPGQTNITFTATYDSVTSTNTYKIFVCPNSNVPTENDPTSPSQPTDDENEGDNTPPVNNPDDQFPTDDSTEDDTSTENYLTFTLNNPLNCSIKDNTITIDKGISGYFSLSFEDNVEFSELKFSTTNDILIEKSIYGLYYQIVANETGKVELLLNGKIIGIIEIIVI